MELLEQLRNHGFSLSPKQQSCLKRAAHAMPSTLS